MFSGVEGEKSFIAGRSSTLATALYRFGAVHQHKDVSSSPQLRPHSR